MQLIPISASGSPAADIRQWPSLAADVGAGYATLYRSVGFQPPWIGYFALVHGVCVGTCGFKAPPAENRVEIAYFTFPGHEGKGFATRMARALIDVCRNTNPGLVIAAQTLPQKGASTAILRKLGFNRISVVNHLQDGEVWEWHYIQPHAPAEAADP